jgi:uncharacterized YccA/Bax inhibitor family protein
MSTFETGDEALVLHTSRHRSLIIALVCISIAAVALVILFVFAVTVAKFLIRQNTEYTR